MQRHRCALILLGGWLLMQPPLIEHKHPPKDTVHLHAPIQEWWQVSAHDTAKECEETKQDILKEVARLSVGATPETKNPPKDSLVDSFKQVLNARCVPADHLYPPKQPIK